jgi:hypothetical protein
MGRFYTNLLILTATCAGILAAADMSGYTHIGMPGWLALLFFFLLTVIMVNMTIRAEAKSNSRFVTGTMGTKGLRMLLCILFIVVYLVTTPKRDVYFIVYFFILYLFFTMFEIVYLIYKLRADKKDGQDSKTN